MHVSLPPSGSYDSLSLLAARSICSSGYLPRNSLRFSGTFRQETLAPCRRRALLREGQCAASSTRGKVPRTAKLDYTHSPKALPLSPRVVRLCSAVHRLL